VTKPLRVRDFHTPLPEEYIWTANDAAVIDSSLRLSNVKRNDWHVNPRYFRAHFQVNSVPPQATLYLAGPRNVRVWINDRLLADLRVTPKPHRNFEVFAVDASGFFRSGENVIAIEAVRGYGSHHHSNALRTNWLNAGEVLAAKLIPAAPGNLQPPLLISNSAWKSSTTAIDGWETTHFDDTGWKSVDTLGGIESSPDFFQWNADTGMYAWPGYLGESPEMANYLVRPVHSELRADGLLLDFGRELSGRILLSADAPIAHAHVRCGESLGELMHAPYLGEIDLMVRAGNAVRTPRTGFRFALVRIDEPDAKVSIQAEGTYDPIPQIGSFKSSDTRLNRIWETAVYTAHLSMQDSIYDGIKRDRGRWIGDDEVVDRVISDVYGDGRLVRAALDDAIGAAPVREAVNGLPGYSAWWIVSESEYIRRWGDRGQFDSVRQRMQQLLANMEQAVDAQGLYTSHGEGRNFVDWSNGFSSDSPEARRALHVEYLFAFRRAAWLLRIAGDTGLAEHYESVADRMLRVAHQVLQDKSAAYGNRWQTNAIAVLAGAAQTDEERAAVWHVLARANGRREPEDVITPYYGSYLLSAMAALGHREDALTWMSNYWGQMLDAGATSFWEAWDPAWAGQDTHARLEADDKVGYNASLAHGWSSGPAAWLAEEILGVTIADDAKRTLLIRPDLAGLQWARGAVWTSYGTIHVDIAQDQLRVESPRDVKAVLLLPPGNWTINGAQVRGELDQRERRTRFLLQGTEIYEFKRLPQ
jgi:hypothetical protein